ncbi:MAG: exosortase system-associated protein, TIGR04073 family [Pedosphaera sp.]|nr:exosortase system-associated protein, TIGR04073 family [Pedosphaera sp.]
MRIPFLLTLAATALIFTSGCAGPEKKLGRGLLNTTELLRGGEFRRSIEQTALWDNTSTTFISGATRGMTRTLMRTTIGVFEVATFPIPTPTYNAWFTPKVRIYPDPSIKGMSSFPGIGLTEFPVYPDSYKPNLLSDSLFHTDTSLGFSGGDVAPMIPGSRFRIFEN